VSDAQLRQFALERGLNPDEVIAEARAFQQLGRGDG
jgi:hypothetical protein